MNSILSVRNLSKAYAGKAALNGVSMDLPPGRVIGLLGPNGSGKTTLLKIMSGVLQPSAGELDMEGGFSSLAAKKNIAFLPDTVVFPNWMRVYDGFKYYGDMFEDYDQALADKMIDMLALNPMDRIRSLSKGMQERVMLGMTLSRKAKLYLLDEPLGGIDPVGKARIMDAIVAMELDGASVVVSTHLIRDIERIFDMIFLLGDGRILFTGDCEAMREQSGKTVEQAYLEVFGYA